MCQDHVVRVLFGNMLCSSIKQMAGRGRGREKERLGVGGEGVRKEREEEREIEGTRRDRGKVTEKTGEDRGERLCLISLKL